MSAKQFNRGDFSCRLFTLLVINGPLVAATNETATAAKVMMDLNDTIIIFLFLNCDGGNERQLNGKGFL